MTVKVQIPYISFVGDGLQTTFAFSYGLTEEYDLHVKVNGAEVTEYSEYTIENVTADGGEVEFVEAPADGDIVLVYRSTTLSQEIDYVSGEPFQANTHEDGFDKFMRILQELITGTFNGIGDDGEPFSLTFDLSVTQQDITVTVVNSGGTDAVLPGWVSAELAGVFYGELALEAELPEDESATDKPDGYVWMGH